MKIVIGGQIDIERVGNVVKANFPEAEVVVKNDIEASMDIKNGAADYYFGACNTGGGGALAMAIALVGANKCATLASPGNVLPEEKIKEEIENGKVCFGFTPQVTEQVVEIVAKYIK